MAESKRPQAKKRKKRVVTRRGSEAVNSAQELKPVVAPSIGSGTRWTFLTNHTHVLIVLHAHPDMVLREVASHVGITGRAVQRIIVDLEGGGFIQREKIGRRNRYMVLTDQPLRHPLEAHRDIGDLLDMVARDAEA